MPHPLSTLGVIHTVISLVPVVAGLYGFARFRRIDAATRSGQVYLAGLAVSVFTSFGLSSVVGVNPGHVLGVLALLAAFGTIVLHVTPEAAVGGPLAHVRSGDRIRLSVKQREIALLVSEEELARRAAEHPVVEPTAERGYRKLFLQTVTQADQGVDFDFLRAVKTTGKAPEDR